MDKGERTMSKEQMNKEQMKLLYSVLQSIINAIEILDGMTSFDAGVNRRMLNRAFGIKDEFNFRR